MSSDATRTVEEARSEVLPEGTPRSVALVSPGWPRARYSNGIVSLVDALLPALRAAGCSAKVVCGRGGPRPGERDVFAVPTPPPTGLAGRVRVAITSRLPYRFSYRASAQRLVGTLDAMGPIDLVEMEETRGVAFDVIRRSRVPVVVCTHGPWFLHGPLVGAQDQEDFLPRVRHEGRAIASAAGVIAPSQDVLDRVRSFYGLPLADAVVIPNAVPLVPPEQRWSLERCRNNELVFVGRFDGHKGGDVVIDAFELVARERPEARLVFIGQDKGYVDDRGKRWALEEYVEHRLPGALAAGRVVCTGQLPPERIHEHRLRAVACVSASRYEVFCLAAIEALATGAPLIASDQGAPGEVIRHGRNGLLFEKARPDQLAEAILAVLEDPAGAARMGAEGLATCAREFSPEKIALQRLRYYARVLERSRRSR